jgi:hypothetical protein
MPYKFENTTGTKQVVGIHVFPVGTSYLKDEDFTDSAGDHIQHVDGLTCDNVDSIPEEVLAKIEAAKNPEKKTPETTPEYDPGPSLAEEFNRLNSLTVEGARQEIGSMTNLELLDELKEKAVKVTVKGIAEARMNELAGLTTADPDPAAADPNHSETQQAP